MHSSNKAQRSIFILDDSKDNLTLFAEILKRAGYQVRSASNPNQAYQELQTGDPPDILLVDCFMNLMTGEEFLIELRQLNPGLFEKTRVVGFSGADASSPLTEGIRRQAHSFIEKAMDMHQLISMVDKEWQKCPAALLKK